MSLRSRLSTPKGIIVLVLLLLFVLGGGLYVAYRWHRHVAGIERQQTIKEFNEGVEDLRAGRVNEAELKFSDVIRRLPDYAEAHNNLGVVLQAKKDSDGAFKEFTEAARLRPDLPDAHNNLATALRVKGDFVGAVREYREVVRIKPSSPDAHNALGVALCLVKDSDHGIEEFRQAVALKADFVPGYFNLACVLAATGKPAAEVAPSLRRAVELEPGFIPVARRIRELDAIRNAPEIVAILGKPPYEAPAPKPAPSPAPAPKPKPKPKPK